MWYDEHSSVECVWTHSTEFSIHVLLNVSGLKSMLYLLAGEFTL